MKECIIDYGVFVFGFGSGWLLFVICSLISSYFAEKSYCIDANYHKGGNPKQYPEKARRQLVIGRMVGRKINPQTGKRDDYNPDLKTEQRIEERTDGKSGTLTTVQKDNLVIRKKSKTIRVSGRNSPPGSKQEWDNVYNKPHRVATIGNGGQGERIYSITGKSTCLSAHGGGGGAKTGLYMFEKGWRKLTPLECERLQTVPDNYTEGVSNTQRYKMLGNGFTVDVIAHLLKNIKVVKNER